MLTNNSQNILQWHNAKRIYYSQLFQLLKRLLLEMRIYLHTYRLGTNAMCAVRLFVHPIRPMMNLLLWTRSLQVRL